MRSALLLLLLASPLAAGPSAWVVRVEGRSMEPAGHPGDLVRIDAGVPFEALKAGQVIAYRRAWACFDPALGPLTVHRLVRKDRRGHWITKADNNPAPDPYCVTAHNYVGLVTYLR